MALGTDNTAHKWLSWINVQKLIATIYMKYVYKSLEPKNETFVVEFKVTYMSVSSIVLKIYISLYIYIHIYIYIYICYLQVSIGSKVTGASTMTSIGNICSTEYTLLKTPP